MNSSYHVQGHCRRLSKRDKVREMRLGLLVDDENTVNASGKPQLRHSLLVSPHLLFHSP